jgi:hypothetical protein
MCARLPRISVTEISQGDDRIMKAILLLLRVSGHARLPRE